MLMRSHRSAGLVLQRRCAPSGPCSTGMPLDRHDSRPEPCLAQSAWHKSAWHKVLGRDRRPPGL